MLRYHEIGELAKDFHGTLNTTINYIIKNYGKDTLKKIFNNMGQKVYKSIHTKLMNDDPSELIEHIAYFFNRENADFYLKVKTDEIILTVRKCPAIAALNEMGLPVSPHFCLSTTYLNEAICKGTKWKTKTTKTGAGSCIQRFYKEADNDTK
ncbi:MAG: hypothetical protein WCS73_02185 [Lentisphaeria bacterium]